jgi:hypothetical protein
MLCLRKETLRPSTQTAPISPAHRQRGLLRSRVATLLTILALSVGVLATTPASAHSVRVSLVSSAGNLWGTGSVSEIHNFVLACDERADNRGMRTEYKTSAHPSQIDLVGDPDGYSGICGQEPSYDGSSITFIRVCARDTSTGATVLCTGWTVT